MKRILSVLTQIQKRNTNACGSIHTKLQKDRCKDRTLMLSCARESQLCAVPEPFELLFDAVGGVGVAAQAKIIVNKVLNISFKESLLILTIVISISWTIRISLNIWNLFFWWTQIPSSVSWIQWKLFSPIVCHTEMFTFQSVILVWTMSLKGINQIQIWAQML